MATFKLKSEEAENVVNDFLAGISSLYEGIGVEERGRALRDLIDDGEDQERDEEEEEGYFSDRSD
jgi:hypothetical protein